MRRQSREIALQILFQKEFAPLISYSDFLAVYEDTISQEVKEYADELIKGVINHQPDIDSSIQKVSAHWKIDRMSTIDRNILRLAVFEMKFATNPIKHNIVINEAIEIARKFGTTDSASFVNGILDQIAKGL